MTSRNPSILTRLARWAAALAGAGVASATPIAAQSMPPSAAPVEWVRYAESATTTITGWLEADSEPAKRLRSYLDATRATSDQATAPLVIKVWIERDGKISRIDYPAFAHAEANADLQALIVGQQLSAAPPSDMLLPLRIAVQLDAPTPTAAPAENNGTALHRTCTLRPDGDACHEHYPFR
ncbi:MAG: hypothetical protein B7Y88_13225 [Sphingomonadales bacterium 32-64-17]|nr:MAG: hypothetical protein B7Y88_13225 [Sphingomonadales bacterium 32-64-17]